MCRVPCIFRSVVTGRGEFAASGLARLRHELSDGNQGLTSEYSSSLWDSGARGAQLNYNMHVSLYNNHAEKQGGGGHSRRMGFEIGFIH